MNIIVDTHNVTRIERDIRPPMKTVITLPLIVDGSAVEGISIYLAVSAFAQDGPTDARLRTIAQEIAIKLQRK
jgi:hypothetical protein